MKKSFSHEPLNDYKRLHISAKITSHEVIYEDTFLGDKYVVYIVNIFTFYKNWTVRKRYSNFQDLHKSLQAKIKHINFPEFPPKRIFKNSESTIEERKLKFENYLNFLFRTVNICSYEEILNFVEVEKELLGLLMKNNTMIESKTSVAVKRYYSMKKNNLDNSMLKKAKSVEGTGISSKENYYSSFLEFKLQDENVTNEKSANMMVVEEFLRNLEFKFENKYDIVKTFEQFLKGKKSWPNFKREEISKLFYGDTFSFSSNQSSSSLSSENSSQSRSYLKGLFYHVGNIEQNVLGAETCLEFLGRLIYYEFNPDCEAYVYMLKTSKIEHLLLLRLHEHLKCNKLSIITICHRILKAIVSEDKYIHNKLKKLITNDEIARKFMVWFESEQESFT